MIRHLFLLLALAGCGDDDGPGTTNDDAGTADAGPPTRVEDLAVAETLTVAGITGRVEVVQDDRGMWHVYAETVEDALRAEGFLMARDRMGAMEFVRRSVEGRLAELASSVAPQLVGIDTDARWEGHVRNAREVLATLEPDELALLEAFSDGVNAYVERVRNDDEGLPDGVSDIVGRETLTDWTPLATLSIARYQAASLSFDYGDDVSMTDRAEKF
jgi:penicillin amidase